MTEPLSNSPEDLAAGSLCGWPSGNSVGFSVKSTSERWFVMGTLSVNLDYRRSF